MKIKNKKNNFHKIVIAVLIVTVIGVCVTYALFNGKITGFNNNEEIRTENTVDYNKPSSNQEIEGERIKDEFDKKHYGEDTGNNESNSANINISSVNQKDDILEVRTIIQTQSKGECIISISQNGNSIFNDSSTSTSYGSYSVCNGFNIDVSKFEKGIANINLVYNSNSIKEETNKEISVK